MNPNKTHAATQALFLKVAIAIGSSVAQAQTATAPGPDAIRAKLLATPAWIFEWSHEVNNQLFVNTAQLQFEQHGDKLMAKLDMGVKCEEDAKLLPDAVIFETCYGQSRTMKFDPADNTAPFKEIFGSYTYIIRPASR